MGEVSAEVFWDLFSTDLKGMLEGKNIYLNFAVLAKSFTNQVAHGDGVYLQFL